MLKFKQHYHLLCHMLQLLVVYIRNKYQHSSGSLEIQYLPKFGCNEDIFTLHFSFIKHLGKSFTYFILILIDMCTINVTVSILQSEPDCSSYFTFLGFPCPVGAISEPITLKTYKVLQQGNGEGWGSLTLVHITFSDPIREREFEKYKKN